LGVTVKRLWAFLKTLLIAEAAAISIGGVLFFFTGVHTVEIYVARFTFGAFFFGAFIGFLVLSLPALAVGLLLAVLNLRGKESGHLTVRRG
jgi:hypothetical protein